MSATLTGIVKTNRDLLILRSWVEGKRREERGEGGVEGRGRGDEVTDGWSHAIGVFLSMGYIPLCVVHGP